METRSAHLRATFDLLCWCNRTSRSSRSGTEEVRQGFRSKEIQRPGDFLREPASEIRARTDGIVECNALSSTRWGGTARRHQIFDIVFGEADPPLNLSFRRDAFC